MNAPVPTTTMEPLLNVLVQMMHSELKNYIAPGLSSLLAGGSGRGQFRAFDATRTTHEFVTPHSHRFDFAAYVIQGSVIHTKFVELGADSPPEHGDMFRETMVRWTGVQGQYDPGPCREVRYADFATRYEAGQWYGLAASDVHSIKFRRGSLVLFLEGPPKGQWTRVLEPIAYGQPLPTFKVEPWMFEPFGPRAVPPTEPTPAVAPKRRRQRRPRPQPVLAALSAPEGVSDAA
jgi:hypothetical protein